MDSYLSIDRDAFMNGFIAAAQWQAFDDNSNAVDKYDFSTAAIEDMRCHCARFIDANKADLEDFDASEAGHCFALSANYHGAGFLDHKGAAAKRLCAAAHKHSYDVDVVNGKLEINFINSAKG